MFLLVEQQVYILVAIMLVTRIDACQTYNLVTLVVVVVVVMVVVVSVKVSLVVVVL
jgi:hypothetical protein